MKKNLYKKFVGVLKKIIINKKTSKVLVASFLVFILVLQFYPFAENALAQAAFDTDTVIVTLTVDSGITISDGLAVTMAPHIGVVYSSSTGSSTWTVITNDNAGYQLLVTSNGELKSPAGPAFDSFADYTEASVPETWLIGSPTKEFGISAFGDDTSTLVWGSDASPDCEAAVGVPSATLNYSGISTTTEPIARNSLGPTPFGGVETTICFAAEQKGTFAKAGTYTTTVTGTATVL